MPPNRPSIRPVPDWPSWHRSATKQTKQILCLRPRPEADPDSTKPLTSFPLGALGAKWLPDGQALVVLAYVLKGHLDLEATAAELARRKESKFVVHATEDAIYRYWDTWLTTGEVPHLFRVDLETGQPTDLTPASTRWWNWPNTDDPLDSFDISPDGRHIAYVGRFVGATPPEDQATPLRTRPRRPGTSRT